MFVYSLKASTLKFFGVICLSVIALIALIAFIPSYEPTSANVALNKNETINYEKIKTNEDRIQFLSQFGWQVNPEAEESANVTVPAEFDKVFIGYNEIQKKQGLNLDKYKKKDMMRYTYVVTNYPDYDGKVYANILVYKNKIVAGDICSSDVNGFIHGFTADIKLQ